MSTLFDLLTDLEVDGVPSEEWLSARGGAATIDDLWAGGEALWMAKLATRVAPRRQLVAAACMIARRVERLLPLTDRRSRHALERAEHWLENSTLDLERLNGEWVLGEIEATPLGFGAVSAVDAAYDPSRIAVGEVGLDYAVLHAENAIRNGERVSREAALAELATLIRANISCPTLDELRAAYSGEKPPT